MCNVIPKKNYHRLNHKVVEAVRGEERHFIALVIIQMVKKMAVLGGHISTSPPTRIPFVS